MAYHFSANQFEDQYDPRKLGNWEYPKWYPERPRQRFKSTKIIADDKGRLLEGIKRENPWGNYVGTWDLPRRITRDYVKKLTAPPQRLVNQWTKKKEPSLPKQAKEPSEKTNEVKSDENLPSVKQRPFSQNHYERRNMSSSALDLRQRSSKSETVAALQNKTDQASEFETQTLDKKIQNILASVENTTRVDPTSQEYCREIKTFPKSLKDNQVNYQETRSDSVKGMEPYANKSERGQSQLKDVKKLKESKKPSTNDSVILKDRTTESPTIRYPELQIAKQYHEENLKHKPLPDVIDDSVYKALMSRGQRYPNVELNGHTIPCAVGWKSYSVPGPTDCSKLKVFRPKTALDKIKPQKEVRPKTGRPKLERKKHFLPIDLAICWDLKPDSPEDGIKRSPHIDGSNGSAAPAVFAMVPVKEAPDDGHVLSTSSQAITEKIPKSVEEDNIANLPSQNNDKNPTPTAWPINKEAIMTCIKSTQKEQSNSPVSINSVPQNSEFIRRNHESAWSTEGTNKEHSYRSKDLHPAPRTPIIVKKAEKNGHWEPLEMNQKRQSTPNIAQDRSSCETDKCSSESSKLSSSTKNRSCTSASSNLKDTNLKTNEKQRNRKSESRGRNCLACNKPNVDSDKNLEKTKFKPAFKAGLSKSENTMTKYYKVPKMRLPYMKKSYSIGTLIPPFSFWHKWNGQEYPEHWRLASIYQHSYKPINTRKRPLLSSVYQ